MKKSLLVLPVILGIIVLISVPSVVAQSESDKIPSWIKGVANFWIEGGIDDADFIEALEFLIESGVIVLPNYQKIPPVILDDEPVVKEPEPIEIEEEPEPLIHVTTNKKSYQNGDNIIIRGTVPIESQDIVTTVIVSPDGNIVTIIQIIPNNGVFQSIFKAGDTMNVNGEYEVRTQQGSEKNYVTFDFIWDGVTYEAPPPEPIAEPDQ